MLPYVLALAVLFGATAFDGATEHTGALVLRALAASAVIALWPRDLATLPRRALVAPLFGISVAALGLTLAPSVGFAVQPFISAGLVVCLYLTAFRIDERPLLLVA